MYFIKLEDGKPVGNCIECANLEAILTDVDFSTNPPPAFFESRGYGVYEFTERPCCTHYEEITEVAPVKGDDGIWHQTWQTTEVLEAKKKAIDVAKKKEIIALKEVELRRCADAALSADMSAADKAAYANYHDAILSLDLSDPFNVTWPPMPGMEQL